VISKDRYDAIHAVDLIWTTSGTATLETALLNVPMIIIYHLSWPTYLLTRALIRVDHIKMINLIADEKLMPELIQRDATPERIVAESRNLLDSATVRSAIVEKLSKVRERLGEPGAAERVAQLAFAMMA
jgi:lipid-A-disaccharide synthase